MLIERLAGHAERLFGVTLGAEQRQMCVFLADELLKWNQDRANLTAITDPTAVETRHFLDSMSLFVLDIPPNAVIADVGTGGGFPGLVLKILRPDVHLLLVESVGKKTAFLQHIVQSLQLEAVTILTARAETVGQDLTYREQCDVVVARSLAHMPVLMEYLLPLCKVGGRCIAMKGPTGLRELAEARTAIETLGGNFASMRSVSLPDVEQTHVLLVIRKGRHTPSAFPRRVGVPAKRPILRSM